MTKFTLTKGKDQYQITITADEGKIVRYVDGKPSTSSEVVRPIEANDRVSDLIRKGYKAQKSTK